MEPPNFSTEPLIRAITQYPKRCKGARVQMQNAKDAKMFNCSIVQNVLLIQIQDSWIQGFNLIIEMIQNSSNINLLILYIIIYNISNIILLQLFANINTPNESLNPESSAVFCICTFCTFAPFRVKNMDLHI